MTTPTIETIATLLAQSPYASSNQAPLEAYLDGQAKGEVPYFMDANRTLLKLYQFFPQSSNATKTATVLLLSLLEFPSTDLLAMSYLIPERIATTEPSTSILQCATLLDACKFDEFWKIYGTISATDDSLQATLVANKGTERLQSAIVDVLALSYRTASLSTVLVALNVTSGEEVTKLKHPNIESVTGDKVTFLASSDNTKRNRVFQEGVNFGAIASMMARVTTE
jgi:CSN8/PSMD8/EIF3K family